MLIKVLAPAAVAILCGATLFQIARPSAPRLLYNTSASAPVGWYRLYADRPITRDQLVAAYAPRKANEIAIERQYLPSDIPLIKTVWAVGGERVCHAERVVSVAGRPPLVVLSHDSRGRALPSMDGCYKLSKDEVFLVSTDVQTSFDSRYFGPVLRTDVIGPVRYLGRPKSRAERLEEARKVGHG